MWSDLAVARPLPADDLKLHVDAGGIAIAIAQPDPIAGGPQSHELIRWLDACEREVYEGLQFARDRRIYLAAHGLTRALLAACTGVPPSALDIRKNGWGRPSLHGPRGIGDLHFSLSHTRGLVACAACKWPEIGIDVENPDREGSEGLPLAGLFTADEIQHIESTAYRAKTYFSHWTLKEAYSKARGLGLHLNFSDFGFRQVDGGRPMIEFPGSAADDPARWNFWLEAVAPSHLMALASGQRADNGILRCAWEFRESVSPARFQFSF